MSTTVTDTAVGMEQVDLTSSARQKRVNRGSVTGETMVTRIPVISTE